MKVNELRKHKTRKRAPSVFSAWSVKASLSVISYHDCIRFREQSGNDYAHVQAVTLQLLIRLTVFIVSFSAQAWSVSISLSVISYHDCIRFREQSGKDYAHVQAVTLQLVTRLTVFHRRLLLVRLAYDLTTARRVGRNVRYPAGVCPKGKAKSGVPCGCLPAG